MRSILTKGGVFSRSTVLCCVVRTQPYVRSLTWVGAFLYTISFTDTTIEIITVDSIFHMAALSRSMFIRYTYVMHIWYYYKLGIVSKSVVFCDLKFERLSVRRSHRPRLQEVHVLITHSALVYTIFMSQGVFYRDVA